MTKHTLRQEQRARSHSLAGGEMGAALRAVDWSRSPLGEFDAWSSALRAAVNLCLNTPVPAFVCCRHDLVLYNDACRDALGNARAHALGRAGRDVWPEHWDVVEPIVRAVFDTGEPKRADNVQLIVIRAGAPEDRYFTFSCSPIADDAAGVVGVFVLLAESEARAAPSAADVQREHEPSLQVFGDAVPALISYIDRDGVYRFANHCYHDWFGQLPGEIVGRHLSEVLGQAAYAAILPHVERVLAGERVTYEARVPYEHAGERAVLASYVPDRDAHGVRGFFALVQDISDRKRIEDALSLSEHEFRTMFEAASVGILQVDSRTRRLTRANRKFCEMLGYSADELAQKTFTELTHPDDRERDAAAFQRVMAGELKVYDVDKRYLHKDGTPLWTHLTATILRDDAGRPECTLAFVQDISERKQLDQARAEALVAEHDARAEAELLRDIGVILNSELDLRALLQRVTDAATAAVGAELGAFFYTAIDEQGERYDVYALSGAAPEVFAGYPVPRATALLGPVLQGQSVVRCDDVTLDPRYGKSGAPHGMPSGHMPVKSFLGVPVKSRAGEVLGSMLFGHAHAGRFDARDERTITGIAAQAAIAIDNARLFDMVRAQASRLQATYEHAALGIAEANLDGRFIGANDKYCEILGYPREELLRLRYHDITHPDDIALDDGLYRELQAGTRTSYDLEKRYVRKDGGVIWVKLSVSMVRDAQGRAHYGVAVVEDITERRRAATVIMGQKKALEQIARGEPIAQVLETLVDTFDRQSTLGGTSAILLFDPDARLLRPVTTGQLSKEWIDQLRQLRLQPAVSVGPPQAVIEDVTTAARWESARASATRAGVRGAWSLTVCSPSQDVLGMFVIFYAEPWTPNADELRFIDILTDTVAVAVERHRAEKSLRLQAQVLSHIHDAVIMTDRAGQITRWNEGAERLFGYSADEAIGQNVGICYFPEDRAALEQHLTTTLINTARHDLIARLRRRSGEALYGHISLSLLYNERGKPSTVVAYVLDMTARVQAEEEIGLRARQQEATARIGHLALSGVGLQDLIEQAVQLVAQTLGVELCKVLELEPEGATLLLRAGFGWHADEIGRATVPVAPNTQAGHALLSGTPVIVNDFSAQTQFQVSELLQRHGAVSGIAVAIHGDAHRPYGVLAADSTRPREFSAHDVNFLQSVADVLATALSRKRVEAMLEQARDDLERRVDERTAELARANQSLRDEIVDRMGVESALRDSEAQYRMLFERNPLPAWVFEIHTRSILAANETAVWQYGYTRDEFLRMTIDALHPPEEMSRVLDYAEQFPPETAYIGVWKHRKQDETVIDVEMFVYEVLFQGRWARLVLANDITERRRAEQEFRLLETITRAISEARDLDGALHAVVRQICDATGWVVGEAWLPTPDAMHMVCGAWHTGAVGVDPFRVAPNLALAVGTQGLIDRAWNAKHPVWMSDVTTDREFSRATTAHTAGLRAGTAFPVLAENEIVALLAFFLREPRREDERLVKLVSTLAAQLGVAIQRKRAEEQLRRSELQLSEAQHLAHLGSWEWDVGSDVLKWSDELYRIYGIEPGTEMNYETYLTRVHPDDRERVNRAVMLACRTRNPFTQEERIVRTDGELRHLLSQGTIVTDARGQVTRVVGVCLDITERKRAEERLRDYTHRLQGLSQRLLEAQETERRRIARELHDQIGQDLSVIKINLQSLKRLPADALTSHVDETIRVVEGVLNTARNLSLELRPSMLDDLGLAAALRWYLDRQAQRTGFLLQFSADSVDTRLQPTIETACFRLAQEAITNIMRHAKAQHVQVTLQVSQEELQMHIIDDGNGFDVDAARARAARGESFGLLGMEERALLAGGKLEIMSNSGQGTTVTARFPLNPAAST